MQMPSLHYSFTIIIIIIIIIIIVIIVINGCYSCHL